MIVVGYFLKKVNLFDSGTANKANSLVFRVFLPIMLFLNVYKNEGIGNISMGYVAYGAAVVIAIFLVSIPLSMLVIGCVLATVKPGAVFKNWRIMVACVARLLVIPGAVYLCLLLFKTS